MGPLKDIRVLDLSRIMAGPWAGQILADLGADVIKVERPGKGDDTRSWGPPFLKDTDGNETPDAGYYLAVNRGKRSIEVELDTEEGQETIRRLAARSDIVLENFKFGTLERYGLDYASLTRVKPDIIYCSITGFGQNGPFAQRAGYDFMIQGMAGIMSITGQPDGAPGAEPMKVGVAFADIFTGLYAVIGMQGALFHRQRTGEGQYIDMALLDSQVAVLANQALNYLVGGKAPTRLGNAHPNIVPYQTFATKDGYIIMAVGTERQFREYCTIIGVPELSADSRFKTNRDRVENRDALVPLLAGPMKARTTAEWVEAFEAAAVPCGPINTIDQVFANPQVLARGVQIGLTRDDGVQIPGVANPIQFSGTPIEYDKAPPRFGDGTEKILQDVLGLDGQRIAALKASGAIG